MRNMGFSFSFSSSFSSFFLLKHNKKRSDAQFEKEGEIMSQLKNLTSYMKLKYKLSSTKLEDTGNLNHNK